jgi:A/G-specific adenine glycosylase
VAVASSRLRALRAKLLAWWDAGHRDLPWRARTGELPEPYRVWISEVMLQQTRVDAVIPYYARFVARFPTLEALAAAPEEEVLALWSGLGYYARARNLHRAARTALARHGGLPRGLEELRALPGFGPYTAGAVASIAFDVRAAAVDGNVTRVLARLFLVDADAKSTSTRAEIAALAGALVPSARAGDWNQALMDLGATVCTKPVPACVRCPLLTSCEARRAGRAREIPPARVRPAPRTLHVACAVVRSGDSLLLARREGRGLFGGLWDLPSAEVPPGPGAREALRVALAARGLVLEAAEAPEPGEAADAGAALAHVSRVLTHRRLELVAFAFRASGRLPPGHRFVASCEIDAMGLSTATRRVVEAVRAVLPSRSRPRLRPGRQRIAAAVQRRP